MSFFLTCPRSGVADGGGKVYEVLKGPAGDGKAHSQPGAGIEVYSPPCYLPSATWQPSPTCQLGNLYVHSETRGTRATNQQMTT